MPRPVAPLLSAGSAVPVGRSLLLLLAASDSAEEAAVEVAAGVVSGVVCVEAGVGGSTIEDVAGGDEGVLVGPAALPPVIAVLLIGIGAVTDGDSVENRVAEEDVPLPAPPVILNWGLVLPESPNTRDTYSPVKNVYGREKGGFELETNLRRCSCFWVERLER